MPRIGAPELIIILFIVLIVFGVGRLTEVGGALGKGIRAFRRGQSGEAEEAEEEEEKSKAKEESTDAEKTKSKS